MSIIFSGHYCMKYRTLLLDALRLHFDEHLSRLDVGRRLGIPKSTLCALFVRFKKLGMSWPLPDNMTADKLESQLYPARPHAVRLDIPAPVLGVLCPMHPKVPW
ncbi:hypothetical protein XNC1_p0139 (plasmid) [Xenorhabdus nematophila ATCC 19061]|uniref:Transposase n=1 Tax=Xenorhabdus nematophila (strain ATCC 19061 / DSM 3370 / CCUG 14189 / LMG 1036 / NCIMB 9965 / AN6) TaxID=406817 RepID=D3VM27_XENNA|nr:hypothetical protein XNC1_p0111 [Xenorhabdus nematophila ATCC 19061]CBJ93007.1 hypothetical protein XNC1_p0139 [Xenorhabdus nematophila ATCC 19061]